MEPSFIEYPHNEFSMQSRVKNETGGFAGPHPRPFGQLKYVLPELTDEKDDLVYDVRTAILLQGAGIRNDLSALVHKMTLKGIGLSDQSQTTNAPNEPLKQVADVVCDQIGLGSANNLASSLVNSYYWHVENQISHRVEMIRDKILYCTLRVDTFVLKNVSDLGRNGFPAKEFSDMPERASAIIYSRMRATMTRWQVESALKNHDYVNRRYDKSPRLIIRANHPYSLYDNWSANPTMEAYSTYDDSRGTPRMKQKASIPLDPVVEHVGLVPKPKKDGEVTPKTDNTRDLNA